MVEVSNLVTPEALVEIEADAVINEYLKKRNFIYLGTLLTFGGLTGADIK
jgi:hypothetical protein